MCSALPKRVRVAAHSALVSFPPTAWNALLDISSTSNTAVSHALQDVRCAHHSLSVTAALPDITATQKSNRVRQAPYHASQHAQQVLYLICHPYTT